MNKVKFLLCIAFASMVLTACVKEDNPVDDKTTPTVNLDDPQETVTDQPAYGRAR
jgi:PBP1b-binding outer membrane lipoprotein LpoB